MVTRLLEKLTERRFRKSFPFCEKPRICDYIIVGCVYLTVMLTTWAIMSWYHNNYHL